MFLFWVSLKANFIRKTSEAELLLAARHARFLLALTNIRFLE